MMDPTDDDFCDAPLPPREGGMLWRLSALMWLLGIPGVLVMAWQVGGHLQRGTFPDWALSGMLSAQMGLLLAAAVFFGSWLAPRVGLDAPLVRAVLAGRGVRLALHHMWLPGVSGGVLGAAWIVTLAQFTVDGMVPGDPLQNLPLWAKLLYSGVSTELLVHWGGMTMLLFALWRLVQPRGGVPHRWLVWLVIVLMAVVLALAHLPHAMALSEGLTPHMWTFVLIGNGVWGLLTGYIYWRYGMEAAIVAHVLALALSHGLT